MKNEKYRRYIYWGVTAFVVLAFLVAFVFLLINWARVRRGVDILLGILAPITWGAVFAYLLTPIYNRVRTFVMGLTEKLIQTERTRKKLGGLFATVMSLVVLLAVVTGLISMLIPQLISSVLGLIEGFPAGINNLERWLERVFADNPAVEAQVMQHYGAASDYIQNWLSNQVIPNTYSILTGLSSGVFSVLSAVKDILIGLIVMVYLLNMKEKLVTQAKMIAYGVLPLLAANKVIEEARYVHKVFGGFIIGKLLDSLIIGLLSFVLLSVMKMPYVLLISVIIGVTNVIPFFGPFIGAIPSAFFILLVSPMKCLLFIGFIFLLQQVDGNIIGPKILGDSTGLSSFWVLFSILLFGGLFGFVGMIIGVPTFAVLYRLTTELVTYLLRKKELSGNIEQYERLNHIEESHKTYIKKQENG
ncbi:MAG: AI-2E family transporter [Lachnospiraceae bacterium]|nr:AI-2E family transporter [Lachnospiraceae bacterium]